MKRQGWKKFSVLGLVMIMILSTIAPALAQEVTELPFSNWAMAELNEVEKYGLFPMEWYEEGFTLQISDEKLDYLLDNTDKKLEGLGLEKNADFEALDYPNDETRLDTVTRLYNLLYKYEVLIGNAKASNAVDYFVENNILMGDNGNLKLDEKATIEQSVVLAKRFILHVYDLVDKGAQGFLWEVSKNDNIIYLMGSIHTGSTELYPINKDVRKKFMDSDYLVLEADIVNPQGIDEFMALATYTDGTSLVDHLSSDIYEKTIKVFEMYGLPVEVYSQFKPWSIANDLSLISISQDQSMEQAGENAMLGIDYYFATSALVMGKPILELEGLEYQANLFNNLSMETQEEYLEDILDGILSDEIVESTEDTFLDSFLDLWFDLWIDGDVDTFRESYTSNLDETSNEEFTQMLLGQRDKDMADKLAEYLEGEEGKTYFVVVGAAHLAVEDTIIDKLIDMGYDVK